MTIQWNKIRFMDEINFYNINLEHKYNRRFLKIKFSWIKWLQQSNLFNKPQSIRFIKIGFQHFVYYSLVDRDFALNVPFVRISILLLCSLCLLGTIPSMHSFIRSFVRSFVAYIYLKLSGTFQKRLFIIECFRMLNQRHVLMYSFHSEILTHFFFLSLRQGVISIS